MEEYLIENMESSLYGVNSVTVSNRKIDIKKNNYSNSVIA